MNHFDNIGFIAKNESEFQQIIGHVAESLTARYPHPKGWYGVYHDTSGAELWLGVNHEHSLDNVELHLQGYLKQQIGVSSLIQYDDQTGAILGWINGTEFLDNECVDGVAPLVFCVPDFFRLPENMINKSFKFQLSAFAQEVKVFENETEFDKSQENEEMPWAANAFIPSGMFVDEGVPYQPYAIFNSTVQSVELKINSFTNQPFYHCTLKTLDMELDAALAVSFFDKPLKVGNIITGTYWLSGKLIE